MYRSVTTVDGLMFHLYGPEIELRHDMTLFKQNGIGQQLQSAKMIDGRQYCAYGDAAYILRAWLRTDFGRAQATENQLLYNLYMRAVLEAAGWTYKDLKQIWSSQDFKPILRVRRSPIALLFNEAALL